LVKAQTAVSTGPSLKRRFAFKENAELYFTEEPESHLKKT